MGAWPSWYDHRPLASLQCAMPGHGARRGCTTRQASLASNAKQRVVSGNAIRPDVNSDQRKGEGGGGRVTYNIRSGASEVEARRGGGGVLMICMASLYDHRPSHPHIFRRQKYCLREPPWAVGHLIMVGRTYRLEERGGGGPHMVFAQARTKNKRVGWCTHVMPYRRCMTVDPRITTIPGRSTSSSFHRPGGHFLHQTQRAVRCQHIYISHIVERNKKYTGGGR